MLAAERLANLIGTIRGIDASDAAKAELGDPINETLTVIGHSQGTIITLLAQALLAQRGQRCADCLIMVDSPYSVHTTEMSQQTGQAKLKTFVDIVNAVTQKPHSVPDLAELLIKCDKSGGRTGHDWSPEQGKRKDPQGQEVTFKERDNRGKVYMYFCPEDTVCALSNIHGIGTFGMPDTMTYRDSSPTKGTRSSETHKAMEDLQNKRFYQRMWTRMERDHNGDGKFQKVQVGLPPARLPLRNRYERRSVGPQTNGTMLGTARVESCSARHAKHAKHIGTKFLVIERRRAKAPITRHTAGASLGSIRRILKLPAARVSITAPYSRFITDGAHQGRHQPLDKPQLARNADAIGTRAARMAGSRPPIMPTVQAKNTPETSSDAVTVK